MVPENTEVEDIESTEVSKRSEGVNTEDVSTEGVSTEDTNARGANAEFKAWIGAFKQIFPIYLSTHIAFIGLTYLATLFRVANYSDTYIPLRTFLYSWFHWDSGWYTNIALNGYYSPQPMGFFPLFPWLERALMPLTHDPFYAGLIISNLAGLGMLMVLYRLVAADFDHDRAWRTVLYLALFPTAFFFAAAYTESLFMLFALLTFYLWRRGHWWLAGLTALVAGLTRSTSVCLLFPFAYEYLRQHDFQWRKIRFDVLSGIGTVGGAILFSLYGYVKFHDFMVYSHSQEAFDWQRYFSVPWTGFQLAISHIAQSPHPLSFLPIHTMIDLSLSLFIPAVLILAFVGPVKFRKEHLAYSIYAVALYLSITVAPMRGPFPINSMARYMLEIFPAFIILATLGQRRNFNLYYLTFSVVFLAFLVLQWVTGGVVM